MTMITPSYLGETIEYSSLHACRSTLEDPTGALSRADGATTEGALMPKTYLMCGPDSAFADDVHTTCATCGTPIVHRPHVPLDAVPMCLPCTLAALAADGGTPRFQVTEDTLREVALYTAKTRGTQ